MGPSTQKYVLCNVDGDYDFNDDDSNDDDDNSNDDDNDNHDGVNEFIKRTCVFLSQG